MVPKKTPWKRALLIALLFASVLFAGCHEDEEEDGVDDTGGNGDGGGGLGGEVVIGGLFVLSGPAGSLGQSAQRGMQLAQAEINAGGGVGGKKLELVFGDTKLDATEGTREFQRIIADGKVDAVVGALSSTVTQALLAPSKDAQVVLISPASTLAELTKPRVSEYFFRTIPSDIIQGTKAASLLYNDLEKGETVVMYQNNAYANGLKDVFVEEYTKLGGQVDGDPIAFHASDVTGYPSEAQKAVARSPAYVYISGQYPEIGHLIKELRQAGYTGGIMTSEAIKDNGIFEIATTELEGVLFTFVDIAESQAYKDFQDAFEARFAAASDIYAVYAYDAVYVLREAIEKGGPTGPEIRAAVQDMSFGGRASVATVDFNQNGDVAQGDYVLWRIEGGKFVRHDL